MSRGRRAAPGALGAEAAIATVALPLLLWVATLVAVVAIDLGAYLVAGARAQQLADASALAAVAVDVPGSPPASPERAADRVATAGGGVLETCACEAGRGDARVEVSVSVPGLVLPRLGATRVTASAAATLVEDLPAPPGRSGLGGAAGQDGLQPLP